MFLSILFKHHSLNRIKFSDFIQLIIFLRETQIKTEIHKLKRKYVTKYILNNYLFFDDDDDYENSILENIRHNLKEVTYWFVLN